MKKYHYVYLISNIVENKYYIGVRSSKLKPEDDLGFKYFSSSKDKEFLDEQKEHPERFVYKVINEFPFREQAIEFEIELHNQFDVGANPYFYNRAKQTSIGFNIAGNLDTALKISETFNSEEWQNSIGNEMRKKRHATVNSEEWKSTFGAEQIKNFKETVNAEEWKSTVGVERSRKQKETKSSKEWKSTVGVEQSRKQKEVLTSEEWKSTVGVEQSKKQKETKSSEEWKSTVGVEQSKKRQITMSMVGDDGLTTAERTAKKVSTTRKERGIASGSNNPRALRIHIFDENDELMFECFGNFFEVCKENKLPYKALSDSYRNNSKKIYDSDNKHALAATKNENIKFAGWYAKIIK